MQPRNFFSSSYVLNAITLWQKQKAKRRAFTPHTNKSTYFWFFICSQDVEVSVKLHSTGQTVRIHGASFLSPACKENDATRESDDIHHHLDAALRKDAIYSVCVCLRATQGRQAGPVLRCYFRQRDFHVLRQLFHVGVRGALCSL